MFTRSIVVAYALSHSLINRWEGRSAQPLFFEQAVHRLYLYGTQKLTTRV